MVLDKERFMVTEDTPPHAASAALCQWERTADGHLIARWRRGCRVSPNIALYVAGARCARSGTDRRHPSVPGLRASERLTAATVIVAMYLITGFGLFSVFVAR
jgi:hypothetical protein